MDHRFDEIETPFLQPGNGHGLTQEQLGEKTGVSQGVIHYVVMGLGMFARQHNLTRKEACKYLARFKGLKFTIDNYEAEHQLSLQDCVDDMTAICQRNGGML